MTQNLMNFLKMVSENDELASKIMQESDHQTIIAAAKEMGVELTEADFDSDELCDEELDAVVGGTAVNCSCAVGGGGKKDDNDKTCACVATGLGYSKSGENRCFCALAGFGYDY